MDLDVVINKGRKDRPAVIFIHGLAVDKEIWINPLDTKVFAKSIPLKHLAATRPRASAKRREKIITTGNVPRKVNSLWSYLADERYNLICWSQRRPVGPIEAAVEELSKVMAKVKLIFPGSKIALIGHSRGGLVARKYMESGYSQIRALITIASPHAGSSLSNIGKYLAPLHGVIKRFLPGETHGTVSRILNRVSELIEGKALKELTPGSEFFLQLRDSPSKEIDYLSFGGKRTELVRIYKWSRSDSIYSPKQLLTIPDSLLRYIPSSAIPDELRPGKGDIMVTAKSAVLPWTSKHFNVNANHFTILWNKKVIKETSELLQKI